MSSDNQTGIMRRLWRLINAFEKVRQGGLGKGKQKILQSKPECV